MIFLTDVPVVQGSSTEIVTLIVMLLGGGALGIDRFRNRNHKNNPGSHDEMEAIKTAVTTEGDKTREALHRRFDSLGGKIDENRKEITGAVNEARKEIVDAINRK